MFNQIEKGDYIWKLVGTEIIPIKVKSVSYRFDENNNMTKIRLDFELPLFENKLGKAKSKSMKRIHKNVNFKNKLLNISINFSNDNLPKKKKFNLPFMDEIKSFKSEKAKSDKAQEKFKTEMIKINSENEKINNLIPNIKKRKKKYIFMLVGFYILSSKGSLEYCLFP